MGSTVMVILLLQLTQHSDSEGDGTTGAGYVSMFSAPSTAVRKKR